MQQEQSNGKLDDNMNQKIMKKLLILNVQTVVLWKNCLTYGQGINQSLT